MDDGGGFAVSVVFGLLLAPFIIWYVISEMRKKRGELYPEIICAHCQKKGFVYLISLKRKKGISGGKATAAILTAGVSMLATGLSRKEAHFQAHCKNCGVTYDI